VVGHGAASVSVGTGYAEVVEYQPPPFDSNRVAQVVDLRRLEGVEPLGEHHNLLVVEPSTAHAAGEDLGHEGLDVGHVAIPVERLGVHDTALENLCFAISDGIEVPHATVVAAFGVTGGT